MDVAATNLSHAMTIALIAVGLSIGAICFKNRGNPGDLPDTASLVRRLQQPPYPPHNKILGTLVLPPPPPYVKRGAFPDNASKRLPWKIILATLYALVLFGFSICYLATSPVTIHGTVVLVAVSLIILVETGTLVISWLSKQFTESIDQIGLFLTLLVTTLSAYIMLFACFLLYLHALYILQSLFFFEIWWVLRQPIQLVLQRYYTHFTHTHLIVSPNLFLSSRIVANILQQCMAAPAILIRLLRLRVCRMVFD